MHIIERDQVRVITPELAADLNRAERRALLKQGWVVPAQGGDHTYPDPLGVTVSGSQVTVDDYTNPPSRIPLLIRDLVAANEGYFIDQIYNMPGMTVNGGAIVYQETFPEDHFLKSGNGEGIAPRAPGAEAPKLSIGRRVVKVARPVSWSGSIDITDEARRRNNVIEVNDLFRRAANSFASILQDRGEETLSDFVTASSRSVSSGAGTFADWAAADPVENTTSTDPRPSSEFARVRRLFAEDKAGVQPDTVIVSAVDAEHFDRVYGGQGAAVLARYGLTMRVSIRQTSGHRLYVRSGQVGTIAFEKPLGTPEYTRHGNRWTDEYSMEVVPVFVANGADAILEVVKT